MKRPKRSYCSPGQEFVPNRTGMLMPVHTPKLGADCRCGSCRQRRLWTPEKREARSAAYRARIAAGEQFGRKGARYLASRWTLAHDRVLRSLLGTMDTADIADELTRRFGCPRTTTAVRQRVKVLGLSRLAVRPWSQPEVARHLGVSYDRVRGWVRRGWLTGTPWRLGGGHRPNAVSQAFSVADVERLVRERPGLVRADHVRHPGLRALVVALSRGLERAS